MLDLILKVYSEEICSKDRILEKMKKMNIAEFILFILNSIFILLAAVLPILIGKIKIMFVFIFLYILVGIIDYFMFIGKYKIGLEGKIEQYNEKYDKLKNILEINSFLSGNKIQALIKQIDEFISESEHKKNRNNSNNKAFYDMFLLPIFTFVLGVLSQTLNGSEALSYSIIAMIFLIYSKIVASTMKELLEDIFGAKNTKLKKMRKELIDLYNRDYIA